MTKAYRTPSTIVLGAIKENVEHSNTYRIRNLGYRSMTHLLKSQGYSVGENRVRQIMRQVGIKGER